MADEVAAQLQRVREVVAEARGRGGRGQDVAIVAVTKLVDADRIRAAYQAGQRIFGENRVQEGAAKVEELREELAGAAWHLIGHLQTNKAKQAAQVFSLIQSVDSLRLAEALNERAGVLKQTIPILVEVNVAGESSKYGFRADELGAALPALLRLPQLELRGLMTVAPLVAEAEEVRWVFRTLRERRDEIQGRYDVPGFVELSMGMSADFEAAIEEGATMVRVGRAIFGERMVAQKV